MKKKNKKDIKYNPEEWDDSKAVEVKMPKSTGVSTSIRLPKNMIDNLRKIAERKGGVGYQTLLKIWIAERLEEELKKAN